MLFVKTEFDIQNKTKHFFSNVSCFDVFQQINVSQMKKNGFKKNKSDLSLIEDWEKLNFVMPIHFKRIKSGSKMLPFTIPKALSKYLTQFTE